jgi:hypothetical protein
MPPCPSLFQPCPSPIQPLSLPALVFPALVPLSYQVSMSYIQIYMELIQDLLKPESNDLVGGGGGAGGQGGGEWDERERQERIWKRGMG